MMLNLKMNKKGQLGLIKATILLIIFVLVWALWLGKFIADYVSDFLSKNYVTGVEAFFWANMNLWIFVFVIIATLLLVYGGASQS